MALIAAALVADGESTVKEVETVERGYGDLVDALLALGADVRGEAEMVGREAYEGPLTDGHRSSRFNGRRVRRTVNGATAPAGAGPGDRTVRAR